MLPEEYRNKNYYEILGVEESAGTEQIQAAYRELSRFYDPNSEYRRKVLQAPVTHEQLEVFALLTQAFHTLLDSSRRAEYDRSLPLSGKSVRPSAQPLPHLAPETGRQDPVGRTDPTVFYSRAELMAQTAQQLTGEAESSSTYEPRAAEADPWQAEHSAYEGGDETAPTPGEGNTLYFSENDAAGGEYQYEPHAQRDDQEPVYDPDQAAAEYAPAEAQADAHAYAEYPDETDAQPRCRADDEGGWQEPPAEPLGAWPQDDKTKVLSRVADLKAVFDKLAQEKAPKHPPRQSGPVPADGPPAAAARPGNAPAFHEHPAAAPESAAPTGAEAYASLNSRGAASPGPRPAFKSMPDPRGPNRSAYFGGGASGLDWTALCLGFGPPLLTLIGVAIYLALR